MTSNFYKSWIRVRGPLLGIIGLILAIIPFYGNTDWILFGKIFFPACILIVIVTFVAVDAAVRSIREIHLPGIKGTRKSSWPYESYDCIALVPEHPYLKEKSMITIYIEQEELEDVIGAGDVLSHQKNGLFKVGVKFRPETLPEIKTKVNGNDAAMLRKLIIKPTTAAELKDVI